MKILKLEAQTVSDFQHFKKFSEYSDLSSNLLNLLNDQICGNMEIQVNWHIGNTLGDVPYFCP